MSGTLQWRPPGAWQNVEDKADPTLRNTVAGERVLNRDHLERLKGMVIGGVPGADQMIEMIEKYDEIEIRVVY